ncbi:MAG: hypothetical protein L0Y60_14400 [Beijerinckiaceae bacterium]|nr:hypothetical protein [Beijerinckiaceae bacterium]
MTDEIFRRLATEEFAARCKSVADDIRSGKDISLEETAERLDISLETLLLFCGAHHASKTGEAVLIMPPKAKEEGTKH